MASMGSVTVSNFVSRSSLIVSHGASGSETKTSISQVGVKNQIETHKGLKSLNNLDVLRKRTPASAICRTVSRKTDGLVATAGKIVCEQGMNIVFVAAEVTPWSKTGGLGDVLGGLPPALAARGHRVMTIAPRYDQYKDAWDTNVTVEMQVGDEILTVRFFHCYKRGVDRVFVDHPIFLEKVWGKTKSKLYGPNAGVDYDDNQLRFSLLCQAALLAPLVLNLDSSKYFSGPYGEDVVFVANDWHTALLPCYLKSMYKARGIYETAKVAFCIHNIAYQGRFAFSDFSLLNLPDQFKSSFDFTDGYVKPVKGRKINWMKAGILESDRVLTVSPYYAQELVSGIERGVELDTILRLTTVTGILNGMDVQEWNPTTDKYIPIKFNAETVAEAKALLKEALQAEVGLPVDRNIPLIGFIGRLEEQKGSDILSAAIPNFIHEDVQLVVLGTGKKYLEQQLEGLEIKYPDKARGVAKFNVPLAHLINAAADFLIIPSRFEPCGLIQLQAMPYGTIPLVSTTGGLADTVIDGYTGLQMGAFSVECETVSPADAAAIAKTVLRAIALFGTAAHKEMIQNCMAQDFSWKGPAKQWEKFLLGLGVDNSQPGMEGEEIAPLAKENLATP
ncbi:granule-bound starch synthase 1, chloroplastic/amyloplastic [Benincasa hispida]|uniref:granule-bound starch synthase 1, chloroplastic/amyloplastic n=1 Tax=Benincasa hispida TaxID=102211 RepID=UPI001900F665|nr:granule-bound starch synthase 1, chloroplastic/amyloplastic [Benincasa hispida]XP_038906879.1 granule-bound starch synthase 1, chloroplastic/amyloplastic [Benincasa hispida]XP_038906880.1 granule-bound starch synthase 1, chloroplastic/amyloplastic [Benincasa hispida]